MSKSASRPLPPDQAQRLRALDAARSILVQAPAGSGKTDLLTRRFLRLLAEVEDPGQIVAITFTKAAAAEMRHRILSELEIAALNDTLDSVTDAFSMPSLAQRALARSRALGWNLPDLPAQLRISTIDSFCRDLAIQQPLLSGFASDLEITEQPAELYRRAARRTMEKIGSDNSPLSAAIESLLLWRDNSWQEMETLLVNMLSQRDRWMHDFVLTREPDWEALRVRLERPFAQAIETAVNALDRLLDAVPHARAEAMALARFACEQTKGALHQDLAELAEFPVGPFPGSESLDEARRAFGCLADLLLTKDGGFRRRLDKNNGFPSDRKAEKSRLTNLIAELAQIEGLASALAALRELPPVRYTDEEWLIVRACFTLLRDAAGQLQIVFAEAGVVDFTEVSQIAQRVLIDEDSSPSNAAIDIADGIRHLLVDEFQDTSRRQHRLLSSLAAAWSDQSGRTIFVVGDPMQSIYFFRDADAELFPRVQQFGLEIPGNEPFLFDFVPLTANFRTAPGLVGQLNESFTQVFARDDGSGVRFSPSEPAREPAAALEPKLNLHLQFTPQTLRFTLSTDPASIQRREEIAELREAAHAAQTAEIVDVIRGHLERATQAQARGDKYRIAVLARARKSLAPIAAALREANIPFAAVELEHLKDRPEVLDALALARALLNPLDRVAWLGILRAPWCGLSLADLHTLTSSDDPALIDRPIPDLLAERIHLLGDASRPAAQRVLDATTAAPRARIALPTASLGTWLQQVWLQLGGAGCVDATARANLDLLWACLDRLPNREQDLLGPALDSALEKLTALPDPEAGADCGVQLMTIHKSKGLEFEVVIVPDLQATGRRSQTTLLSWLERGLAEPDESGDVTEFLVAPVQSKGADRGSAKQWVDRVYRERESQEMRRLLYVAATRVREELHLFARPEYKNDQGALTLIEPTNSLLATAWPAFADEISTRFDAWRQAPTKTDDEELRDDSEIASLAASADNLVVMPSPIRPTILHRLPADFQPPQPLAASSASPAPIPIGLEGAQLYTRHEGGTLSRALGSAVHALLEEAARLRAANEWPATRNALTQCKPRITAQVRAAGIRLSEAESIAARALDFALKATNDPYGQWVLSPHTDAASETAWAGVIAGALRTVRVDRIFRAGLDPLSTGSDAWWIVDYKTAHAEDLDPGAALPELRRVFAPQLEAYAAVLRKLQAADMPVRAALYYPRMSMFDWWEISI